MTNLEEITRARALFLAVKQSGVGILLGRVVTYATSYPLIPATIIVATIAIIIYKLSTADSDKTDSPEEKKQ